MLLKVIWGIISVYSILELGYLWIDWYRYLHKARKDESISVGGVAGNYLKLGLKAVIPGILGMIGAL